MKPSTKVKKSLSGAAIALFWLLVWQSLSIFVGKSLLLPSPLDTLRALFELCNASEFYFSVLLSLARITAGYCAGVIVGVGIGVLTAFSPFFDMLLKPLRSVIKATPVSSFIILALLYLTVGVVPAFTAFLMVLPIVWTSVYEGIKSADTLLVEMTDFFHVPMRKKLTTVYMQSTLPQLKAACTTSLGFAWKSGVAAEVLATPAFSLGKHLYESKIYLETEKLFAVTAVVIVMSVLLEKLVIALLQHRKTEKEAMQ